jgi:hypothetical protein
MTIPPYSVSGNAEWHFLHIRHYGRPLYWTPFLGLSRDSSCTADVITELCPSQLNNQLDAFIIQILFCHKALHVSGIFRNWSSILTLLGSGHQTCMKRTNAECTLDSSWWWAEKMPETCTALWQNKIWIISASSWLFNYEVYHDARPHEHKTLSPSSVIPYWTFLHNKLMPWLDHPESSNRIF